MGVGQFIYCEHLKASTWISNGRCDYAAKCDKPYCEYKNAKKENQ